MHMLGADCVVSFIILDDFKSVLLWLCTLYPCPMDIHDMCVPIECIDTKELARTMLATKNNRMTLRQSVDDFDKKIILFSNV